MATATTATTRASASRHPITTQHSIRPSNVWTKKTTTTKNGTKSFKAQTHWVDGLLFDRYTLAEPVKSHSSWSCTSTHYSQLVVSYRSFRVGRTFSGGELVGCLVGVLVVGLASYSRNDETTEQTNERIFKHHGLGSNSNNVLCCDAWHNNWLAGIKRLCTAAKHSTVTECDLSLHVRRIFEPLSDGCRRLPIRLSVCWLVVVVCCTTNEYV